MAQFMNLAQKMAYFQLFSKARGWSCVAHEKNVLICFWYDTKSYVCWWKKVWPNLIHLVQYWSTSMLYKKRPKVTLRSSFWTNFVFPQRCPWTKNILRQSPERGFSGPISVPLWTKLDQISKSILRCPIIKGHKIWKVSNQ